MKDLTLTSENRRFQLYNTSTGGINSFTESDFDKLVKFYKLIQIEDNLWCNGRKDIYAWEMKGEEEPLKRSTNNG